MGNESNEESAWADVNMKNVDDGLGNKSTLNEQNTNENFQQKSSNKRTRHSDIVSPMSGNGAKTYKYNKIAPLIYFKLDEKFISNKMKLDKEVSKAVESLNINIKEIKITRNRNLLIFRQ